VINVSRTAGSSSTTSNRVNGSTSRGTGGGRNDNGETGAFARGAGDIEAATVVLHNLFHDRKSDSRACLSALFGGFGAEEF
jgi:hypothetical protein